MFKIYIQDDHGLELYTSLLAQDWQRVRGGEGWTFRAVLFIPESLPVTGVQASSLARKKRNFAQDASAVAGELQEGLSS